MPYTLKADIKDAIKKILSKNKKDISFLRVYAIYSQSRY